jgi:hypothetical protein
MGGVVMLIARGIGNSLQTAEQAAGSVPLIVKS